MTDNLQNRYKAITYEVEELLSKLKERDDVWIDIGKDQEGEDYSNKKINENIKEKVEDEVLKRKEAWDIINDIYNKQKDIYDKVKDNNCDIDTNNLYKIVGKNVTLQRRYLTMDYDILLKKENIKLLLYCIVVLFICLVLIILNIVDLVTFATILPFYLGIITVYIFYLVKVVLLDRVNRNNINFHKFDFNKPDNSEIEKAKENVDGEKQDGCTEDVYGRVATSYKQQFDDEVLEDVKTDSDLDAPQCLAYM